MPERCRVAPRRDRRISFFKEIAMTRSPEIMAPFFEPYTLGSLRLRNRVLMAPMTRYYSPEGVPGDNVVEYYRRRAAGGVGLIVTEGIGVDDGMAVENSLIPKLVGAERIAGWQRVTAAVHAEGGAIAAQLWHQGPLRGSQRPEGPYVPGLRPSGLWGTPGFTSCTEEYVARALEPSAPMTEEQIADVIAAYGTSARNARAAGFDGVELHGAHGYMIDAFLWAGTNRRTDRWGGDVRRRAEFAVEVVRAVRAGIGPDKPVVFRFSQHKQQDYDARFAENPDELGIVLNAIADAGADAFHASTRRFNMVAFPEISDLTLAGWARKLTGKPSIAVGGIGLNNWLQDTLKRRGETLAVDNLPELRALFDRGMFDLFAVGRALINDPAWAQKARDGTDFAPYDKRSLNSLA